MEEQKKKKKKKEAQNNFFWGRYYHHLSQIGDDGPHRKERFSQIWLPAKCESNSKKKKILLLATTYLLEPCIEEFWQIFS
jgi:hypothetical protein